MHKIIILILFLIYSCGGGGKSGGQSQVSQLPQNENTTDDDVVIIDNGTDGNNSVDGTSNSLTTKVLSLPTSINVETTTRTHTIPDYYFNTGTDASSISLGTYQDNTFISYDDTTLLTDQFYMDYEINGGRTTYKPITLHTFESLSPEYGKWTISSHIDYNHSDFEIYLIDSSYDNNFFLATIRRHSDDKKVCALFKRDNSPDGVGYTWDTGYTNLQTISGFESTTSVNITSDISGIVPYVFHDNTTVQDVCNDSNISDDGNVVAGIYFRGFGPSASSGTTTINVYNRIIDSQGVTTGWTETKIPRSATGISSRFFMGLSNSGKWMFFQSTMLNSDPTEYTIEVWKNSGSNTSPIWSQYEILSSYTSSNLTMEMFTITDTKAFGMVSTDYTYKYIEYDTINNTWDVPAKYTLSFPIATNWVSINYDFTKVVVNGYWGSSGEFYVCDISDGIYDLTSCSAKTNSRFATIHRYYPGGIGNNIISYAANKPVEYNKDTNTFALKQGLTAEDYSHYYMETVHLSDNKYGHIHYKEYQDTTQTNSSIFPFNVISDNLVFSSDNKFSKKFTRISESSDFIISQSQGLSDNTIPETFILKKESTGWAKYFTINSQALEPVVFPSRDFSHIVSAYLAGPAVYMVLMKSTPNETDKYAGNSENFGAPMGTYGDLITSLGLDLSNPSDAARVLIQSITTISVSEYDFTKTNGSPILVSNDGNHLLYNNGDDGGVYSYYNDNGNWTTAAGPTGILIEGSGDLAKVIIKNLSSYILYQYQSGNFSELARFDNIGQPSRIDISSDGSKIALVRDIGNGSHIEYFTSDDNYVTSQQVSDNNAVNTGYAFSLSGDGTHIFSSVNSNNNHLDLSLSKFSLISNQWQSVESNIEVNYLQQSNFGFVDSDTTAENYIIYDVDQSWIDADGASINNTDNGVLHIIYK